MYPSCFKIYLCCWILIQENLFDITQGTAGDKSRITNGENVVPHEFPFMVALHAKTIKNPQWHHICGAALVTKRHVVTAAHCYNSAFTGYSVVLGAHEITESGNSQRIKVWKWQIHPGYKKENNEVQQNDIAVLVLRADAQLNEDVGTIPLPTTDVSKSGETCTAMGWGRTSEGGPSSQVLMKAHLKIVPFKRCSSLFHTDAFQDGTTCAYGAPEGTCAGDSGGPLVCENPGGRGIFLFGVVSSGHVPCGGYTSFELYARVGYKDHLNFVTNLTSQEITGGREDTSSRFQISYLATGINIFMILRAGFGLVK